MLHESEMLRQCFLFEGVPAAVNALGEIAAMTVHRGAEICHAGHCLDAIEAGVNEKASPPVLEISGGRNISGIGVLLEGRARATTAGGGGRLLTVFKPGDVFGAASLWGGTFVSNITAMSDCRVFWISEALLRQVMADYPQVAVNYIGFLSRKVRFLNGKLAILSENTAESRVYAFLTGNCDENGRLSGLNLSQVADQLSMGRTSLYRALDELEAKSLIRRHAGDSRAKKIIEVIL